MNGQDQISVSHAQLEEVHKKLLGLMAQLPEEQASALRVILARASAAKELNKQEVDEFLLASPDVAGQAQKPLTVSQLVVAPPTLAQVAKALDGTSRYASPAWTYTAWTYRF